MANVPLKTIKFPGLANTYTVPQIDTTLAVLGFAAESKTVGDRFKEIEKVNKLLDDNIPNTTQEYTFADGAVSQIVHKSGNTTVRTDVFTYSADSITETRTLAAGGTLTIVTNLTTLETSVTYTAA